MNVRYCTPTEIARMEQRDSEARAAYKAHFDDRLITNSGLGDILDELIARPMLDDEQ